MSAPHVYVHVPFCTRRCSYCAFSIVVRRDVPVHTYIRGIEREVKLRFHGEWKAPVTTLYLGGGTPSRLGGSGVRDLLAVLRASLPVSSAAEITLEVNPEDVDATSVAAWQKAGVNRISLGVQSFDNSVLEWMHRVHDSERAKDALAILAAEFSAVSTDLIFALPDALGRDLERDVSALLAFPVGHISLYGLTAEPHTPFARWLERGAVSEAPEERYEAEFLWLHATLAAAGFEHYEVSSFAMPGRRAVHNAAYWSGERYVGFGPAAHGYDGSVRRWNVATFDKWIGAVDGGHDPILESETLSAENRLAEDVYLGMRVTEGLILRPGEEALVGGWVGAGWGQLEGGRLRLSPLGWLRLDSLAASLTALRSR